MLRDPLHLQLNSVSQLNEGTRQQIITADHNQHKEQIVNWLLANETYQKAIVFTNTDTTTLRDMDLFLRYDDRMDEDTLTVRIAVVTPDSLRHEEAFRLALPAAHTPAALSREADLPYRRRIRFARTGDYCITVTPGRPVKGVEAVGINIVKSE